jgi:hypothetical protein
MSFTVARRTREIGIRAALGAEPATHRAGHLLARSPAGPARPDRGCPALLVIVGGIQSARAASGRRTRTRTRSA